MRIYNPSLGRFLSVDPDIRKYPYLSSYCYAANNPIFLIDRQGRGPIKTFIFMMTELMHTRAQLIKGTVSVDFSAGVMALWGPIGINISKAKGIAVDSKGNLAIYTENAGANPVQQFMDIVEELTKNTPPAPSSESYGFGADISGEAKEAYYPNKSVSDVVGGISYSRAAAVDIDVYPVSAGITLELDQNKKVIGFGVTAGIGVGTPVNAKEEKSVSTGFMLHKDELYRLLATKEEIKEQGSNEGWSTNDVSMVWATMANGDKVAYWMARQSQTHINALDGSYKKVTTYRTITKAAGITIKAGQEGNDLIQTTGTK